MRNSGVGVNRIKSAAEYLTSIFKLDACVAIFKKDCKEKGLQSTKRITYLAQLTT